MTDELRQRYARTLAVDGFDEHHQDLLEESAVLVIGCGALGSQVAIYLAASGVGRLGLVDFDNVDISNLQRQVVYRTADTGQSKATVLAREIAGLNPTVKTDVHNRFVRCADDVSALVAEGGYTLVIEATDNARSKHTVTAGAALAYVPCVLGGVEGWRGQVMTILPGTLSYEDIFGPPSADTCSALAPCAARGVIGPVPGIVSAIQATEAIKLLAGLGRPLTNRLLTIDSLTMSIRTIVL